MYYLYVLSSLKFENKFYIGVTSNLKRRLHQHNKGWSKSTKPYIPWALVYSEEYKTKEAAYKREWFLKSPKGYLEKKRIFNSLKKEDKV